MAYGDLFRMGEKRVSRPIRDVNGTKGVDSQKAVPVTHKCTLPDLFPFSQLRPHFRPPGGRTGKAEVDGSDPPFLPPSAGAGVLRNSHLRSTPWGGRSRRNYP